MLTLRILFPSGGEYEESIPDDSPILDELGLSDDDRAEIRNGASITKRVLPDPQQLDLSQHLLNTANAINAVYMAGLDHDERMEAGRV